MLRVTTVPKSVCSGLQLLATCLFVLFLFTLRAQAAEISLAWDPSPSTNVGGYSISYGTTSGSYTSTVDLGNVTTATVPNLNAGTTYYFAARAWAYDTTDTTKKTYSAYSNQVSAAIPAAAAPVASFTATATSGVAPLTVTFSDTSTGNVTSRSWALGDGTTATSMTVSRNYATPGDYYVTLTVANSAGSSNATKTLNVAAPATPPAADFTASATVGTAPLTVNFTNKTTGTATAWSWQFGDGGTSTEQNPSYSYAAAGTYTVSLTATGPNGSNTQTKSGYISVTSGSSGGTGNATGLVAAYGFEELSGTAVVDASGNGNHGTIREAKRIAAGRFGNALQFDGINDWVTVNNTPSLGLSSAMTIEAWANPSTTLQGWAGVVHKESSNGDVYGLEFGPAPYVNVSTGGLGPWGVYGGAAPARNNWTHLAATYDSNTGMLRLYVNGQLANSAPGNGTIDTSGGVLRIGGHSVWGEFFTGNIDEVRIYNRVLGPGEIAADANRAVSAATPPSYRIGNNAIESVRDSNPQGTAEAFQVTAQSSAVLTEIQVYVDASSTVTNLVAGIYSDSSGRPKNLLAQGNLASLRAGAWNAVPIPPSSIVKEQSYWIAILGRSGRLDFRVRGNASSTTETSRSKFLTKLPRTWSTGNVYSYGPMSAYGGGY